MQKLHTKSLNFTKYNIGYPINSQPISMIKSLNLKKMLYYNLFSQSLSVFLQKKIVFNVFFLKLVMTSPVPFLQFLQFWSGYLWLGNCSTVDLTMYIALYHLGQYI